MKVYPSLKMILPVLYIEVLSVLVFKYELTNKRHTLVSLD